MKKPQWIVHEGIDYIEVYQPVKGSKDITIYRVIHPSNADRKRADLIADAPRLREFVEKIAAFTFEHEQESHFADDCIDIIRRLQEEAEELVAKATGKAA